MSALFTAHNHAELHFPNSEDGEYAASYLMPFLEKGVAHFIRNAYTELHVLRHEEITLPITCNQFHPENSYICSPYTHYVQYAREEVHKLPNIALRGVAKGLLHSLGGIFRQCGFDACVYVNNWLLSTNLYPKMTAAQIQEISAFLIAQFPQMPIVWRSIDAFGNPLLYETLQKAGYRMVFSRQVFYQPTDGGKILKVRNVENDLKLYHKTRCKWLSDSELQSQPRYIEKILEHYNALYLQKYSHYNPQFTPEFILEAMNRKWLHFRCLSLEDEIVAVAGSFRRRNMMAQPIFGYDTQLPMSLGLYRLLTMQTILDAVAEQRTIHASAGVGKFKRTRGGVPVLEYNAVFDAHLPFKQRFPWATVGNVLSKIGVPMIQKYEL